MYKIQHQAYLDFLKKKVNIDWIKVIDENTDLFHHSIRSRNVQNQVYNMHEMDGVWRDNLATVSDAFLDYYVSLLGKTHDHRKLVIKQIVHDGPLVTDQHREFLNDHYTIEEVKQALFSIPDVKSS